MAKKSRRARRQRTTQPRFTPSPATAEQEVRHSAMPSKDQAAEGSTPRKQVDFSTEYRYVISDLRSMAMIAVAMLGVLIALSFVIR